MYSATVTLTANSTSLRSLINTAVSGEIPSDVPNPTGSAAYTLSSAFDGRCMLIQIVVPTTGTVVLSGHGNTTPPAPPPAGTGVTLPVTSVQVFSAITGNQLSIDEMFLSGTATAVGIQVFVA